MHDRPGHSRSSWYRGGRRDERTSDRAIPGSTDTRLTCIPSLLVESTEPSQRRPALFQQAQVAEFLLQKLRRRGLERTGYLIDEELHVPVARALQRLVEPARRDRPTQLGGEPLGQFRRAQLGMLDSEAKDRMVGLAAARLQ